MSDVQAEQLLVKSFFFVSMPQLQPVVVAALHRLRTIPSAYLHALAQNSTVLAVCRLSLFLFRWIVVFVT